MNSNIAIELYNEGLYNQIEQIFDIPVVVVAENNGISIVKERGSYLGVDLSVVLQHMLLSMHGDGNNG